MLFAFQVGYDLTAGLPGHEGEVTVFASGGEYNVSVLSGKGSALEAGRYIELDGQAYEIEAVDSLQEQFTLVEVRQSHRINRDPCYMRAVIYVIRRAWTLRQMSVLLA